MSLETTAEPEVAVATEAATAAVVDSHDVSLATGVAESALDDSDTKMDDDTEGELMILFDFDFVEDILEEELNEFLDLESVFDDTDDIILFNLLNLSYGLFVDDFSNSIILVLKPS